ncbi:zinc finger BED domain-containing protein RICESLEEPER 2-like [Capsicum annuum]
MGTNWMNGDHLHVRCMTYIINLFIQDSLKESFMSIEHVRHAVRYVRQSPARLKRFQKSCDDEQLSYKKSFCLDIPTRWNSTYLMLSGAVEFKNAFTNYASREIVLRHYLENSYIEVGVTSSDLLSSDWVQVKRITKFLKFVYLLTLKISGSLYVTSNIHFLEICVVAVYLNQLIASEDTDLSNMERKMKEKFDKYWGSQVSAKGTGPLDSLIQDLQKSKALNRGVDSRTELDKYFGEETEDDTKEFKILLWWKMNATRFSTLSKMACDVLAVPVSSVAFESAFST